MESINFIDLGLPSGTLWADRNLGAEKETDYGKYYQWGDTKGYTREQIEGGVKTFKLDTYKFSLKGATEMTKYNSATKYNSTDGLTELLPEDDAAFIESNGKCRIPSCVQLEELKRKTRISWADNYKGSGVNGMLFTSRVNGNTLFIPAAGRAYGNIVYDAGLYGYAWSRSYNNVYPMLSRLVHLFCRGGLISYFRYRYNGFSVRPVLKLNKIKN